MSMFENISISIIIAIVWAGMSYGIAKAKNNEAFEPIKFAKTVAIGFAVGAVAAALQMPPEAVETTSFVGFITIFVDKITSLFMPKKA